MAVSSPDASLTVISGSISKKRGNAGGHVKAFQRERPAKMSSPSGRNTASRMAARSRSRSPFGG
jgi:hypothetical protein